MGLMLPRSIAALCLAFFAACGGESDDSSAARDREAPPPGPVETSGAAVVRIEGPLSASSLALVSRARREALEDKRAVLVIDLETPGGEVDTMRSLGNRIRSASDDGLRTVTWVHDRASSAGVLVALASERVFMTGRSHIGAATPVTAGPDGIAAIPEEGGVRAKIMSDMRGQFRAWAQDRNRPAALAEAMIDSEMSVLRVRIDGELRILTREEWSDVRERGENGQVLETISHAGELLTLTGPEAVETGFADGLAESLGSVLEKVGADRREPLVITARPSEQLLGWLDLIGPMLIALGLALAFTELKVPGFGLPGILSIVCFALALTGQYFVGLADVPHLVLVTVGFALVAVELFLAPGTIWFGLAGGLCILGGLFWSQLGPGFDIDNPLDKRFALENTLRLFVLGVIGVALSSAFVRLLPKLPLANRLVVAGPTEAGFGDGLPALEKSRDLARVGAVGVVRTALRPVGKVVLGNEDAIEFEARSPSDVLEAGTPIVVTEVQGDRLVVEPHLAESES